MIEYSHALKIVGASSGTADSGQYAIMSIRAHSGHILGVFIMASFSFSPSVNKSGKVTRTAEKVADALNSLTDKGLMGAALTGRGTIAKQAKQALKGQAVTLDSLLALPSLDGSQWGDLFGLLKAEFGVACVSDAMKGKKGAVSFMAAVVADKNAKYLKADSGSATDRAVSALLKAESMQSEVVRLFEASEAAAMSARHAVTEEVTA